MTITPGGSTPPLLPKPPHTRVFTISNQKGGVGKTSTAVNIAAALAEAGMNVLVIDNDPQGNASTALGIEHGVELPSTYNTLIDDTPLSDIVQECPDLDNLWCAPANIDLAGAEIELVSVVAREKRLKNALEDYTEWRAQQGMGRLDYVFIDCPPSLGLLTVNAFVAAEEILIPIQCEYYALEGLSQLLKNIQMIQKHLNSNLEISTILLTMYDGNISQRKLSRPRFRVLYAFQRLRATNRPLLAMIQRLPVLRPIVKRRRKLRVAKEKYGAYGCSGISAYQDW